MGSVHKATDGNGIKPATGLEEDGGTCSQRDAVILCQGCVDANC